MHQRCGLPRQRRGARVGAAWRRERQAWHADTQAYAAPPRLLLCPPPVRLKNDARKRVDERSQRRPPRP
eukprot:6176065-Pleurochrysis_carterae.AAC.1